jgi:hypothetical protein
MRSAMREQLSHRWRILAHARFCRSALIQAHRRLPKIGASCRKMADLFGHGAKLQTKLPESETPGNFKSLRQNWNSHSTREMKNASHNQHL